VLLHGLVGVGKTHVATELGHAARRRGHAALFAKTSRVLAELAGGRADGSRETRPRRLARVDLLIVDYFAMRAFSASQGDDFYELVSECAQHGAFILTANPSPKDWYELFPNAAVAESVLDRLVNSSYHVHTEGRSYRPKRRPGQDAKLEKGGQKA
jgi:DNA replication protein DnaC